MAAGVTFPARRWRPPAWALGLVLATSLLLALRAEQRAAVGPGVKCLLLELGGAVAPLWLLRRAATAAPPPPRTTLTLAAAGALALQSSLHLSCPAAGGLAHELLFHFGGVAAAALVAGLIGGWLLRGPTRV